VNTVAIHRCRSSDAAEVANLAQRLFRASYGETHPEPHLSDYLQRELSVGAVEVELSVPDTVVWLAREADEAIGYLWLEAADCPVIEHARRPVHLRRIFVAAHWHGRGVAQTLVQHCLAEATRRAADPVWLSVWQSASRPIAFYRKVGFEVVGKSKFAVAGHEDDDFIMARRSGNSSR
jgi:ribosomal protein S18 acetylase RimI-like enzyme